MTRTLVATVVLLAVASGMALLAGCSKKPETLQGAPAATPPSGTHTMPNGQMMPGSQMPGMQQPASPAAPDAKTSDKASNKTSADGEQMVSCPVLGTTMARKNMIPYEYKGKTYYFCCQSCVDKFNKNPGEYIGHPHAPLPPGQGM